MSYRKFTPGQKSQASRMIHYNAVYNYLRESLNNDPTNPVLYYAPLQSQNEIICSCYRNEINSNYVDTQTYPNISTNMITSQKIKIGKGSSLQFGNYYLGEKPNINYLGKFEGQPGGSGLPLKNKF